MSRDIAAEIQLAIVKTELAEVRHGRGGRASSNHASQLAHPCRRRLFYERTCPELRPEIDERAAFTFKMGHLLERQARADLERAGFEVHLAQGHFVWEAFNIVGSVDGFLSVNGDTLPLEIKSVSGNYWPELTSVQAMSESSHFWVRLYPSQLCLYMLMSNHERGLFYLVNKNTGQPRVLEMALDYDMAERCVKAAEAINKAVAEKTPPDRMDFDTKVCGFCSYRQTICAPPQPLPERMDDPELIAFLEERERLKEASAAYKKAQDRMKEQFDKQGIVEVGPFEVTVTKTKRGLQRKVKRLMEESPIAP